MKLKFIYSNILLLIILLFKSAIFAADFKWTFERGYKNDMLHLHSFVNYEFNPLWHYTWEKNLLKGNGFKFCIGSVTTNDLIGDGQLVINQDLGAGWRFLGYGDWYASRHQNTEEKSIFLGFEKRVIRNIHLFILFNPSSDKEFTDVNMGFSLIGSNRENYLRAALSLEDFVYDEKNDLGGQSNQYPVGVQWLIRYEIKKWCFYGEGKYSSGFERRYPDMELSPDMNFHQQQIDKFNTKLYYHITGASLLELSLYHYHFKEGKLYYESEFDYSYINYINNLTVKYVVPFKEKGRIHLQLHYLIKNANSDGYKGHDYRRKEFLPAIFYEYILPKNIFEFGYMSSIYDWNYDSITNVNDYLDEGYIEKVKFGWTYHFNENTKLQLSISHVVSITNFGGANLQYMMLF